MHKKVCPKCNGIGIVDELEIVSIPSCWTLDRIDPSVVSYTITNADSTEGAVYYKVDGDGNLVLVEQE